MKKSVIQTHRVAAVRAKAVAAGSCGRRAASCPVPRLGWGRGEGGASTGDCETGRVSVSLRGSGNIGSVGWA